MIARLVIRLIRPGRATTLLRRSLTIPAYLIAALLAWLTIPVWLAGTLALDLVRDLSQAPRTPRFIVTRLAVFAIGYLTCEAVGIVIAFFLWVLALVRRPGIDTFRSWNFRLQQNWGATLLRVGQTAFKFRYEVSGQEHVAPGPIILALRHSSLADTVLALAQISKPHNIVLRYVLKRPLLLDPCLDIVGQRLLNHFVLKGEKSKAQVEGVAQLAEGLGPQDGVLIYPEGTRFTALKREQHLARLERRKHQDELEFARSLQHVLPPIRAGLNALLDRSQAARQPADVLFCAHRGFEGSATFGDLLSGSLLGQTVKIHFWRIPASDVPTDRDKREGWLQHQWTRMDRTVDRLA